MSETAALIAVFWALWVIDGVRLEKLRRWSFLTHFSRNASARFRRLSFFSPSPSGWMATAADIPFSFSTAGITNSASVAAGRPVEKTLPRRVWRWEEIQSVKIVSGSIEINGGRFCAATGHISPAELRELAALSAEKRAEKIRAIAARWFRPTGLRRRAFVLQARTAASTTANSLLLFGLIVATFYLLTEAAAKLPEVYTQRIAAMSPWFVGVGAALHVFAVWMAFSAHKKLCPLAKDHRFSFVLNTLLLPPQALRLRAAISAIYFPAQHPVSAAIAFGSKTTRETVAFQTLSELRWPIAEHSTPPLAREIETSFRSLMEKEIERLLRTEKISVDELLAAPKPDNSESAQYCPRCRDQFHCGPSHCPHGIALKSLREKSSAS